MQTLTFISGILASSTFFDRLMNGSEAEVVGTIVLLYVLIGLLFLAYVFFVRIYIAYLLAKNRRRDPLIWVLLSFLVSPVLTWILLLILGDASEQTQRNKIATEIEQEFRDL